MTVDEIKKEIKGLEPAVLQELSSFLLQLRRSQDPERKEEIARLIDSPPEKWVTLEEMDQRLAE